MKKKITVSFILLTLLLGSSAFYWIPKKETEKKTAFIEIEKVYNAFEMKKELESKYTLLEQQRKNITDSLELELKLSAGKYEQSHSAPDKNDFAQKRQEYLLKKKQFEEDNAAASDQYSGQIFQQLNQYIREYGKEHAYTYIFGAEGSGALMYASDSENITNEITAYVNSKYKGKSK